MESVKKNFIYNSLYQILILFIPLVTTPYISRVLGADGIGIYSYYFSIANYFSIFILLGLNNYGNRSIARIRNSEAELRKTFWSIYNMQFLCGCVVLLIYLFFSIGVSKDVHISLIMGLYVVSSLFDINWLFFGLEKFRLTVSRNTIIKIITTMAIFVFIKQKEDVWKYCFIMVFGMLVSQIVIWPFALKQVPYIKVSRNEVLSHLKPNLLLFLTVLATSLFKIMDKIMLGAIASTTEVGFYEASEKIIAIPTALIVSLGTVMLPRMSNLVATKEESSNTIIKQSIIVAMFLSSSMCFGIMAISKSFVPLFYGAGYETCIWLFLILMPSCLFLAFANVIRTQYLLPHKMDKIYVTSAFLGAGVNLLINALLIPKYKSVGAAIGTLAAEVVVCAYQTYSVRRKLPIRQYLSAITPFLVSGVVMFVLIYNLKFSFINSVNMIMSVGIGAVVYVLILAIQCVFYKKITGTVLIDIKSLWNCQEMCSPKRPKI